MAGLQGELSALLHVRNSYGQALRSSIEAFVRESQESRDQDIQQLEAMAAGSEKQTASLERSIKRAMADGTATEQSILHIVEQWQASDRSRREQRAEQFTRMQQSVSANHFRRLEILDSVVQSLTGTVAEAVSLARAHEAAQASRRVQDLEAAVALAKSQIARLEERNRLLEQFGATTQAETASLRNGMLALLDTFGRNQEKSLSLVQEQMRSNGEACVADVRAHQEALRAEEKEREGASFLAGIERIEREGRMQQPEEEALGQTSRDEQAIWAQCSTEASEALEAESQAVEAVSEELKAVATSGERSGRDAHGRWLMSSSSNRGTGADRGTGEEAVILTRKDCRACFCRPASPRGSRCPCRDCLGGSTGVCKCSHDEEASGADATSMPSSRRTLSRPPTHQRPTRSTRWCSLWPTSYRKVSGRTCAPVRRLKSGSAKYRRPGLGLSRGTCSSLRSANACWTPASPRSLRPCPQPHRSRSPTTPRATTSRAGLRPRQPSHYRQARNRSATQSLLGPSTPWPNRPAAGAQPRRTPIRSVPVNGVAQGARSPAGCRPWRSAVQSVRRASRP